MEINSLLCGVSEADLHSVVHPDQSGLLWLPGTGCTAALSGVSVGGVVPAPHLEWWQQRQDAPSTLVCCVVRGSDIADLPTEYMVTDLLLHEHPVIGTYIDKTIVPGFRYQVRNLESQKYLFGGKPLVLKSIGMGYGRRITFDGPTLNNMNYFYSDSHGKGYGFSVVAVHVGDAFVITGGDQRPLGTAVVDGVKQQREVSSRSLPCGAVEKRIEVIFTCTVRHCGSPHGMMPLYADSTVDVAGVAVLVKQRGSHKPSSRIEQVDIPHIGVCTLAEVDKAVL